MNALNIIFLICGMCFGLALGVMVMLGAIYLDYRRGECELITWDDLKVIFTDEILNITNDEIVLPEV